MKFSPKCRTKTILGSFCSFLNWEGVFVIFGPKLGLGKSLSPFTTILVCSCSGSLFCRQYGPRSDSSFRKLLDTLMVFLRDFDFEKANLERPADHKKS